MERTTADLLKFILGQDKTRVVNHHSWHLCAVGDWWHNDSPPEERDPNSWIDITLWMEENCTNWWLKIGLHYGLPTYGDIAKYMKANPPVKQKKPKR